MIHRLLLCLLVVSGLAPAATCTKEFDPGLPGLTPFTFLAMEPNVLITVRSGDHTTEWFYDPYEMSVTLSVDGGPVESADVSSAEAMIASLCGPGFQFESSGLSPVPKSQRPPSTLGRPAPARIFPAGTTSAGQTGVGQTSVGQTSVGQTSEDTVIADFNGDGIPDSAALYGGGIYVTLRGPNGTTVATARYPVAGIGVSQNIVTADFNRDGVPDLAVTVGTSPTFANPFPAGSVVVLLGNHNGTFGAPASFPVGPVFSSYLVAGDFNGDGVSDLALTHNVAAATGEVAVLLGKGDGSFSGPVGYPVGPAPFTLVAGDFNGDGKIDLATLDANSRSGNHVWVLPGRGDGTFQPALPTPSLSTEGHLAYVDLNHDGKLDLVIADRLASAMEVMMGNGDGTFQSGKEYLLSAQPVSIAPLPLGDGTTALMTADNFVGSTLFLYFATADGSVQSSELQMIGARPTAVAVADLNGDRRPDLILTDTDLGSVYVKLGTGNGQFAAPVTYAVGLGPGPLAVADLNRDGKPDVIAVGSNGLDVLMGNGDGTLGAVSSFPSAGPLTSLSIADFNSDGIPDVAAANPRGGGVALFTGNGAGSFSGPQMIPLTGAQAAVSADLNGDNKPDLIVTTGVIDLSTPGSLSVLLGNGDGTFQTAHNIALPGPLTVAPAIGDLNGDGRPDVVVPVFNAGQTTLAVFLGNGDGTFQMPVLTQSNTATTSVAITDLNGDGKPDLVLGSCCGRTEATFLLGNGDGTFQPEQPFPSGPDPTGIAAADLNNDGKPDLAIVGRIEGSTNPNRGTLTVMFNAFTSANVGPSATATIVSAANPASGLIAPGSLAVAYGSDLAQGTPGATSLPLPNAFGGTTVSLVDSAGANWQAPLLYVSASQVNFLLPSGVATGTAQFTIVSGDGTKSSATAQVAAVAPGIFTLNAANLAAATALRISADGTQQVSNVYSANGAGAIVANPISLGSDSDSVYLILFGTGLRAAGMSSVKVTVGSVDAPVQFVGPQGSFAGLDQINVLLPHSLAGSGDVTVQLNAAGIPANPVHLTIQ